MIDKIKSEEESLRFQILPRVHTSKSFNELNNTVKKEALFRLNRLSEEFDNNSEQQIFSSDFLNYTVNITSLLNILLEVNQKELETILLLLFEKVRDTRDTKEKEYIKAASYFVNLLERIGYIGDDHADLNDTILYGDLLDRKEHMNAATLNWEFIRLRAACVYGINLVDDESYRFNPPFDISHAVLPNFNYIVSYLFSYVLDIEDIENREKLKEELENLKEELEDLDKMKEARNCLQTNTKISRKGISLLGGVQETTVENASVLGEIIQIDEPYTKANKKQGIKKNLYFEAKSAHKWLLNRKPGKYFEPLFDNRDQTEKRKRLLTLYISNKEELDKFIKDNEESKKRITDYPLDTIFAINPNKDINKFKGIQKQRLEWLGLDGKSLSSIVNSENPYHEHERIASPLTHIGYDLNQGRVVIKEEES